ncbi:MAG: DEAD/DEAH box helicase [Actinomycetales bacterium]|nr:DEAD/DEAH box helicase [Actinomycetales bacterium]
MARSVGALPQNGGVTRGGVGSDRGGDAVDVLARFTPATRAWFSSVFEGPTAAQVGAWDAVSRGEHALVVAPTGSGKTLAAFLWALDQIVAEPRPAEAERRCRVLYVSPLKALAVDVHRNLRSPLTGITNEAARLGLDPPQVRLAVRSGDTPPQERRVFGRTPPDILITTPESLFLLLTSKSRSALAGVRTVILDEVHVLAGSKRGAHLALSLERLDALLDRPAQRVGLSATVRPLDAVAGWLGGAAAGRVRTVAPPADKEFDLRVVVPVPDLADPGSAEPPPDPTGPDPETHHRPSIWPHVEERVTDLVASHRSTLVFANSRRLAERLTARLNEIWALRQAGDDGSGDDGTDRPGDDRSGTGRPGDDRSGVRPADPGAVQPAEVMSAAGAALGASPVLARAHHGSVSKEQRALIEGELKAGRLPAVVATSSLELGIDMGSVDLVVQVEAPPSVAAGLQRVGRAGHQVGAVSRGVLFPKYRGDLVAAAVVVERMRTGAIEELHVPANPLDVLAQQVVAMTAMDDWTVDDLESTVRRAAPFATLTRPLLEAVLDMLSGRYPSDEFAELRPRLVWDRHTGVLHGRPGAQRLAVTSGGTIPDRGLYGVFLAGGEGDGRGGGRRVGELDEEMVYESRVGDVITLGSTSWRIEEITHDQVLVTPVPGQPGRLPFWKGDAPGRPAELGRAVGAFVRELLRLDPGAARDRLRRSGLDEWAADNLLAYLTEQRESTRRVPDDRTVVVERFRDELGDWRVVVHSPFGARVNAPWALTLGSRFRERFGVDVQAVHADDGIVLRLPDMETSDGAAPSVADLVVIEADDVEDLVTTELGSSALFAARFRECAGRALLLPRRSPGRRQPLWQQRQRAAALLSVASRYGSFPVVLETARECLRDVFDVPGLTRLMRDVAARRVHVVEVETAAPSPFARSLLFGYVAQFLYEGDSPLAERRAAALALDPALLAELLGRGEGAALRDLLDPRALATTEAELQRLAPSRRVRGREGVADLARLLGPLTTAEVAARTRAERPGRRGPAADAGQSDPAGEAGREGQTDPAGQAWQAGQSDPAGDAEEAGHAEPELVRSWLAELETERRLIRVRIAGEVRWAAVEDAARLRDALGTPLPPGVAHAFAEPVADPLGDLISRYARTHGPFTAEEVACRYGLGVAAVAAPLDRLVAGGRLVRGELRPVEAGGSGCLDHCDAEVLRVLRRRSLAALRAQVEPVPPESLARFLPGWQHVASPLRGVDGVLRVVEQLAGAWLPASAVETLVLPTRVLDYSPAMLDELTAAGEVLWSGHGALPGNDGWVSLHPAELAPVSLAAPDAEFVPGPLHEKVLATLSGGGAYFFRPLADAVGCTDDRALAEALWDLVWAGLLSNDTLAPVRSLLAGGRTAHRARRSPPRARFGRYSSLRATAAASARPAMPSRSGPPTVAGRWSLLPRREQDPTVRAHAGAEILLERYGVVTRGSVQAEHYPGSFAAAYRVLCAFEEAGRVRRGYFVAGLGGAQFGTTGAVDRLRAGGESPDAVVLAATDPANPYGAALPWPERRVRGLEGTGPAPPSTGAAGPRRSTADAGHRPGRKAGALVVLVAGRLVLYVERGGRTLLSWDVEDGSGGQDPSCPDGPVSGAEVLRRAVDALARAVRDGALGRLTVERADGANLLDPAHPLAGPLAAAGFHLTPRGLRIRS